MLPRVEPAGNGAVVDVDVEVEVGSSVATRPPRHDGPRLGEAAALTSRTSTLTRRRSQSPGPSSSTAASRWTSQGPLLAFHSRGAPCSPRRDARPHRPLRNRRRRATARRSLGVRSAAVASVAACSFRRGPRRPGRTHVPRPGWRGGDDRYVAPPWPTRPAAWVRRWAHQSWTPAQLHAADPWSPDSTSLRHPPG